MKVVLEEKYYKVREYWYLYKFMGNTPGRTTRAITVANWNFPLLQFSGKINYNRVMVEIDNSVDMNNRMNLEHDMATAHLHSKRSRFEFLYTGTEWKCTSGERIDYVTQNLEFSAKLKLWNPQLRAYIDPPIGTLNEFHKSPEWSIELGII